VILDSELQTTLYPEPCTQYSYSGFQLGGHDALNKITERGNESEGSSHILWWSGRRIKNFFSPLAL